VIQKTLALPLAALLLGFGLAWSAAAPKKKATPKAPATKSNVAKAPVKSAAKAPVKSDSRTNTAARRYPPAKKQATYARGRTRGRSPQPIVARRYYGQQAPTHDRYVEIQQALISRGFLNAAPTGTLDAATVDALKRFQEEQNLPPSGKITSLSLIALGLGPKRNPISASSIPSQPVP
jgi:hypothetical protein